MRAGVEPRLQTDVSIDAKTFFYVLFILVTFLRFLTFFSQTFVVFFIKNFSKIHSGKQINKKHFQNNSNKIDL